MPRAWHSIHSESQQPSTLVTPPSPPLPVPLPSDALPVSNVNLAAAASTSNTPSPPTAANRITPLAPPEISSPVLTSYDPSDIPPPEKRPCRVQLVIKLGGSALTVKNQPHTIHTRRFEAAIDTIVRLHSLPIGFIVVHGAGSFGHFEARAHRLSHGAASPLGVAATHAAVASLNAHVVHALIQRGVPAVGVAPLLVPTKVRNDFVAALLDRGHLPVLHGDACYAGDGRTAVISADALVASLAVAFTFVDRVVFLSDVPGLLRHPPDQPHSSQIDPNHESVPPVKLVPDHQIVKYVLVNETGHFVFDHDVETSVDSHDVTGGITAKIVAAGRCVAETAGRVTAFIAGIGTQAAELALTGRPDRCTPVNCTRICYQLAGVAGITALDSSNTESLHHTRDSNDAPSVPTASSRSPSATGSAHDSAAGSGSAPGGGSADGDFDDESPSRQWPHKSPKPGMLSRSTFPKRASSLADKARKRGWFG